MKTRLALIAFLLLVISGIAVAQDGSIVAWGLNNHGQCDVPEPNSDFIAVAGGYEHSLGLKADGSIVAWGNNYVGQCDVPEPNSGVTAVVGGVWHSLGLHFLETGIEDDPILPPSVVLLSVAPNPFSSTAPIAFELPSPGHAVLEIYDLSGRLVETLVVGEMATGAHSVVLDGSGMASGVYLIRLQSGSEMATARVVVTR